MFNTGLNQLERWKREKITKMMTVRFQEIIQEDKQKELELQVNYGDIKSEYMKEIESGVAEEAWRTQVFYLIKQLL